MIFKVQEQLKIDPQRIFITGLSAGGAMTATMLATYPEIFAGGAIIAGLPHGVAKNMNQAFDRMRGHRMPGEDALQAALRGGSDHSGPWPRISIWHGSADTTVSVSNAKAILTQWQGVHGLSERPPTVDWVDNIQHRTWLDTDGRVLVEDYIIPGMAHGTPLKTKGAGAYGSSAPFMLDVDISSTFRIAQFWDIVDAAPSVAKSPQNVISPAALPALPEARRLHGQRIETQGARASSGIGKVIEDALRAAGLLK
jgi:poly(3-hydroxybutyrate) depolymerase